jgi:hypothetical protein
MRSLSNLTVPVRALLVLACPAAAWASPTVCEAPEPYSFASLSFVHHERAALGAGNSYTDQETRDFALGFADRSGAFTWGIAHRYEIVGFSGIEPQTNGHLHTTWLPLHWRFAAPRTWRISVAPALSASSNVYGEPREWDGKTFTLLAAAVATTRLSRRSSVRYGLCGDHRFGDYTLYPAAAFLWHPDARWRLELGFPVTSVRFEPSQRLRSTLAVAPDGNAWQVADRELAASSRLVYEAIALEWTTEWRVLPTLALSVSLGRQLDNRYELTLADGARVALDGAPAGRLGFGIRWIF